jgi:hypothetical protein
MLRDSRDSQLLRMPNEFGIGHSAIAAYCSDDYKSRSISRTNFRHCIIALFDRGDFAFKAHSELGRKMWNYARFIARAMSAIQRKKTFPHLTYWIEPVETFERMPRNSPARQPNDAALDVRETREEA